jgi:hypothetical protein
MTATAPRKPWKLRCLPAVGDPDMPPRVQATMYLDSAVQSAYLWITGRAGRYCWITHATTGPNDTATLTLDEHRRVLVTGSDQVADAVRKLLARGTLSAVWVADGIIPDEQTCWQVTVDGLPDDLGPLEPNRPRGPAWSKHDSLGRARALALTWRTKGGEAVIRHLTAVGEVRVTCEDPRQPRYVYRGAGEIVSMLGLAPQPAQPQEASS